MPTEVVFIAVTAIVGGLLLLGAALAVLRDRRPRDLAAMDRPASEPAGKYEVDADVSEANTLGLGSMADGVVRVLWWVTVVAVLISVGISGAYTENQTPIYAIGAMAVIAVVVLHELLPAGWRSAATGWLEVVIAYALAGSLLIFTGYGSSPFAFTLYLIAVAVALATAEWAAAAGALLASGVLVGVIAIDPAPGRFEGTNLVQIALSVGAIWLLTLLAAVFAHNERRIRSMLSRLSRIDPLTGLFNRSQIYETLEQEVRRTRRSERGFSILMMDLDGLKTVNDSLGHQRGDEVLRALGRVIREDLRHVDSAYRYGGDEFLVLLPETDYSGAFVVAEKIRSDAEELGMRLEGEGVATSISIGLVSHPEDGSTADELVRAADRALYNAKALGKNQISGFPRPLRLPPPLGYSPPDVQPGPSSGPDTGPSPIGAAAAASHAAEPVALHVTAAEEPGLPPVVEITDRWVPVPEREPAPAAVASPELTGEEEPDAAVVRRQIAVASRSFDPDHQIRAAMDAFLSPPGQSVRRPD